jgi:hypothetical protein
MANAGGDRLRRVVSYLGAYKLASRTLCHHLEVDVQAQVE